LRVISKSAAEYFSVVVKKLIDVACVVAIVVVAILLPNIGYVKSAESWTSDWRTALFSTRYAHQHAAIALVLISEDTLQDSAVRIPIDRMLIAKLVRAADMAQPAAIGLDFAFVRPTNPAADADLLFAIREAKSPVVIGSVDERMRLSDTQLAYHRKFLKDAGATTGHLFFERKANRFGISDHVVREILEPAAEDSGATQSFAQALARFKNQNIDPNYSRIAWLLPPADGSDTFYELDASDLLRPEGHDAFLPGLKGKVVLIGPDLADLDQHLTPLSVMDESRTAGVRIHAQIVAQLIDDRRVRELELWEEVVLIMVLGSIGYLVSRYYGLDRFPKTIAWAGSIALIGAGVIAFPYGIILPYTAALTVWISLIGLAARLDYVHLQIGRLIQFFGWRGGKNNA
jgi:CHASE2 domain-containing sensor protein